MTHQQPARDADLAAVIPIGLGYVPPTGTPGIRPATTVQEQPEQPAPEPEGTELAVARHAVPRPVASVLPTLRPDRLAWAVLRHEIYYGTLGTARGLWALWGWATARELDPHLASQPRLVLEARQRRQRIAWAGLGATTAAAGATWILVGPAALAAAVLVVLAVAGGAERMIRRHTPTPTSPAEVEEETPAPAITTRVVGASAEEVRILDRLEDWQTIAAARRLEGITPVETTADTLGLAVVLLLDGQWTPAKIRAAIDRLRAALAVPTSVRTQVRAGAAADEVTLRIHTRRPDLDTRWHPDRDGIGVVPETGDTVELHPYRHLLVAGTTGAGKSSAMRLLAAPVVLRDDAALVLLDPKGQEGPLWEHCARTVRGVGSGGRDRIYTAVQEVAAELEWRQEHSSGTTWQPTPDHPELVIQVDEGAAIVRMARDRAYRDILDLLEYIATQGRAARIWLHWATQYPTREGGIPAQVTEMMTTRLALQVDSPTADRVIYGEHATARGWTPSELDAPGWAMLRTGPRATPDHIRLWHLSDAQVRALPARAPWHRPGTAEETAARPAADPQALAVLEAMTQAATDGMVPNSTVRELLPDLSDRARADLLRSWGCTPRRIGAARGWDADSVSTALARLRTAH